jgi:hypothetical protein
MVDGTIRKGVGTRWKLGAFYAGSVLECHSIQKATK